MSNTDYAVMVENLTKNYGDYELNISLKVPYGRVTGFVGKNGAGKSTTIKALLGLITKDGGSALVFGKDADELEISDKEKIGVCLADSSFSAYLNVKDIMSIMKNLYHEFDAELFARKCKELKIPMDKEIKAFSTGMKAKVRVLSSICHKATLLIMDEPTAGLDVEARNIIIDLLRKYVSEDENRTILISSHIATDLENLCDDFYLIDNGRITLYEETDVLMDKYGMLKVNEETYEKLDKQYILKTKKQSYGYDCFTNEAGFYKENYPEIVVEKGGIDQLILMMTGGDTDERIN